MLSSGAWWNCARAASRGGNHEKNAWEYEGRLLGQPARQGDDMTKDRAGAVATTLLGILVRHLRSVDLHKEITEALREEFRDIEQTTLREIRPDASD